MSSHVWAFVACSCFVFFLFPLAPLLSLSPSTCPLSCSSTSMSSEPPRIKTTALTHNEEYCPVAIHNPLTGDEPKLFDNCDYSETSAANFQDEYGDIDTEPSYSCDAELDDEIIGKTVSSPLFIQEREEPANLRQACHSWRKFVASSVLIRTHKYETRIWTKFRFVSKTEIKSRPGTWESQDSPCWSQIWDPEARISSRFWQKKYPGIDWNYWFSAKGKRKCGETSTGRPVFFWDIRRVVE